MLVLGVYLIPSLSGMFCGNQFMCLEHSPNKVSTKTFVLRHAIFKANEKQFRQQIFAKFFLNLKMSTNLIRL